MQNITNLKENLDKNVNKIQQKQRKIKDPTGNYDIAHQANMVEQFPDGRAHYEIVTHKIPKTAIGKQRLT